MPNTNPEDSRVLRELTDSERGSALMYRFVPVLDSAQTLRFAHTEIFAPAKATLAFVDQEPTANWGHRCRYVLIDRDTDLATSIAAKFPPFTAQNRSEWRLIYQAPDVPDRFVAAPSLPADR